MNSVTPPSRREFLKTGALVSGGMVIAFVVPGGKRFAAPQPRRAGRPLAPNAFLRVGSDDSVTVLLAHSEMGQGIWTALPMLIAEELDADWSKVKVEHADAAPAYAHTAFGMQMTGGSTSTWSEFDRYRQAGATARALLVQAAAQRFGVKPADCRTESGVVIAGNRRARYGELAEAAATLPAPKTVPLKDPKDWKIIGKPTKRLDTPEKTTGRAHFGMDVRFPGLLTAVVARPPVFGAKVKSFDATAAKAVAGVRQVVRVPTGVAVVADHFWAAKLGRDALKIEWDLGPGATLDSSALRAEFRRLAGTSGAIAEQAGDVADALGKAAKTIEAEYAVPYLAHAPMEPENCTVRIGPAKCEIWTGTQFQTLDQQLAAQITGLKPEQVELHTTFLGGGFGRRANPTSDFVSEAVQVAKAAGDAASAMLKAARVVEAEYDFPYLAHAPMEPLNCTVKIDKDHCEIWTGTQFQTMDQQVAAKITGLKPEQVDIHTTFLGGGFGRRATPTSDFVTEAVHVARAAGKPVKTVWTREDDVHGGYYRPAYVHRARIGLGTDGLPVAWQHTVVGQSILAGTPFEAFMVKNGIDATSVEGVADSPYLKDIPNRRVDLHSPRTGIPVLWWRSVGHSHTAFVMESLIDELAHSAGKDPVEYRRALLKNHPRHLGVLNLAVEQAGWGRRPPKDRARGVAVHESFGSFAAQVAEVSVENGRIRVHRVVCAIDCGIAVNPETIAAQMESGIAFGLSAVLHSALHFKDGRVRESNYHDYRVLRMNEMPMVEVHIVRSSEKPGGIGEVGVPPIAPAVANAVAALTQQRLRELPLMLAS
ncbi:MAG: molybdopterin cofactor-binding domain-containing protein [Gemmatimonadales bacterium]